MLLSIHCWSLAWRFWASLCQRVTWESNCVGTGAKQRSQPSRPGSSIREPRTCRCSSWAEKRQRSQRSNHQHPLDHRKSKSSKNIYFCFDYVKASDCVDHTKLWKILKEMRVPDHLTCLLRNLYAGQEATVRSGHGTTDWFQIWKEVCQGCILSLCLFNLYVEYIMRNAGLESRLPGEISITSDMQVTPHLWQKARN